jgi:hypothetical protein
MSTANKRNPAKVGYRFIASVESPISASEPLAADDALQNAATLSMVIHLTAKLLSRLHDGCPVIVVQNQSCLHADDKWSANFWSGAGVTERRGSIVELGRRRPKT